MSLVGRSRPLKGSPSELCIFRGALAREHSFPHAAVSSALLGMALDAIAGLWHSTPYEGGARVP